MLRALGSDGGAPRKWMQAFDWKVSIDHCNIGGMFR